jgi:hypothetical protein
MALARVQMALASIQIALARVQIALARVQIALASIQIALARVQIALEGPSHEAPKTPEIGLPMPLQGLKTARSAVTMSKAPVPSSPASGKGAPPFALFASFAVE